MEPKRLDGCAQKDCPRSAVCCFTWPGRTQQLACRECGERARNIAAAMGVELEILKLDKEGFPF